MRLTLNDNLTPELLIAAYRSGLFPMGGGRHGDVIQWYDPDPRGILPIAGFHVSRSLLRSARRTGAYLTFNRDFDGVIAGCASRSETWITAPIAAAYRQLHDIGYAHSAEITDAQGRLMGGVYGVAIGQAFFGESMFSAATDGSKLALGALIATLRAQGFTLFDTQFLTRHLASLGGVEIPRDTYRAMLGPATNDPSPWQPPEGAADAYGLLQRMSQMS